MALRTRWDATVDDSSEEESEADFDAMEEIAVRLAIVTDNAADPLPGESVPAYVRRMAVIVRFMVEARDIARDELLNRVGADES